MSAERPPLDTGPPGASFPAVVEALAAIERAVRGARGAEPPQHPGHADGPGRGCVSDGPGRGCVSDGPDHPHAPHGSDDALAALLRLRELRAELAAWEPGLIETARRAGASWADLARPLGVASRQAAERRYLRVRPGSAGSTGEERVQATRDRRAADRSVSAWARDNAGELRRLAGGIASLPDLPSETRDAVGAALGDDDAAALPAPLAAALPALEAGQPALAARVRALIEETRRLRGDRTGG